MRIRKRSIVILSSSTPSQENAEKSNLSGHGGDNKEIKQKEKEEFLLPLVAAVVDVQAKAEAEISRVSAPKPLMGHGIPVCNHNRKNWRDALLRYQEENQVHKEDDKSDYRWDMIMSKNPEDKIEPVANKAMPSSIKDEIVGIYRKRKSPEYGPFEFKNDKPITINSDENCHGGSQCKRRNGRGWRCSQRTLVGYSLCEHHLGKSRFKNINATNSAVTVAVNNKGSKYKELHLIHAASSKV